MYIAVNFGKDTDKILKSAKMSMDNADFYKYSDVNELIEEVRVKSLNIDRICVSEAFFKSEDDLQELAGFIASESPSTSVVVIIRVGSELENTFNEIFNPTLCTCIGLQKVTITSILDILDSDIKAINKKYKGSVEKKPKKSFNFGMKKESAETAKSKFGEGNSKQTVENASLGVSQNVEENVSPFGFENLENARESAPIIDRLQNQIDSGFQVSEKSGISNGGSEQDDDISVNLYQGGFGEEHSDTGFLDEDEEKVIKENIGNVEKPVSKSNNYKQTLLEIYLYESGIGGTARIVEKAMSEMENGNKVLIIDLDTTSNGVLSYIDTFAFYNSNSMYGITKNIVYTEDGIDIMSNGHGVPVNSNDVNSLLNSGLLNMYDVVLIDCPLLNVGNLTSNIVLASDKVNCIISGNRSSLIKFISVITSRKYASQIVEDSLYQRVDMNVVNKISEYNDDLKFVKSFSLPLRENWFNLFK